MGGPMLPIDVIKKDEITPLQGLLIDGRAKRGQLSQEQRARRMQRLADYFNNLPGQKGGAEVQPPSSSFFASCVKIQRPEDVPAIVARHQAEEAAAHSRRALEGALFTLFPVEGKWPSESPWAAMQQVKIRNGFAVKLGPALQRLDTRMAKREAIVLRDSVRESISVPVWQEEGTGHMAKSGAIPDDVMEKIMGLDIAKVKGQSVAAAGIFEWLLSAVDPPSPQKAGMLVHTLTK